MAISRRMFVGGSAAAVGATVAAPSVARAGGDDRPPTDEEVASIDQPILLRVIDAAEHRFELLVGEESVEFSDAKLTGVLARAAGGRS